MNNHDRKTIQKMIEHCNHIIDYMKNCESIDDFEKNTMLVEAVVFNLVQLGELAHTELSDEAKKEMNQIPWKAGMGKLFLFCILRMSLNFSKGITTA